MSKNDSVAAMYTRMPMVAALNKVPGFDPMKLLRRTVSPKTGEEVFKLDLQYKKLWFRLAHPEGRIKLKPLRITEQLAIYEAQVCQLKRGRKGPFRHPFCHPFCHPFRQIKAPVTLCHPF